MLSLSGGAKSEQYSLTVLQTFFGIASKRRSLNLLLNNICSLHWLKNGNKESISVLLNIASHYLAQDSLKIAMIQPCLYGSVIVVVCHHMRYFEVLMFAWTPFLWLQYLCAVYSRELHDAINSSLNTVYPLQNYRKYLLLPWATHFIRGGQMMRTQIFKIFFRIYFSLCVGVLCMLCYMYT